MMLTIATWMIPGPVRRRLPQIPSLTAPNASDQLGGRKRAGREPAIREPAIRELVKSEPASHGPETWKLASRGAVSHEHVSREPERRGSKSWELKCWQPMSREQERWEPATLERMRWEPVEREPERCAPVSWEPVKRRPTNRRPANRKRAIRQQMLSKQAGGDAASAVSVPEPWAKLAASNSNRSTLAQAFASSRELVGMVASEAATPGTPVEDSDIDWTSGSQGVCAFAEEGVCRYQLQWTDQG
jgi:hypothetical protein